MAEYRILYRLAVSITDLSGYLWKLAGDGVLDSVNQGSSTPSLQPSTSPWSLRSQAIPGPKARALLSPVRQVLPAWNKLSMHNPKTGVRVPSLFSARSELGMRNSAGTWKQIFFPWNWFMVWEMLRTTGINDICVWLQLGFSQTDATDNDQADANKICSYH